jgi:hypothetical protein
MQCVAWLDEFFWFILDTLLIMRMLTTYKCYATFVDDYRARGRQFFCYAYHNELPKFEVKKQRGIYKLGRETPSAPEDECEAKNQTAPLKMNTGSKTKQKKFLYSNPSRKKTNTPSPPSRDCQYNHYPKHARLHRKSLKFLPSSCSKSSDPDSSTSRVPTSDECICDRPCPNPPSRPCRCHLSPTLILHARRTFLHPLPSSLLMKKK